MPLVWLTSSANGVHDIADIARMTSGSAITVIVAARNAAAFIHRAIASALGQPEVAQIIVVDDASSDATGEAALSASCGSDRLTVLRLDQNRGPAAARNLALERATTPLVCVLDADDWIKDGRFTQMLANGLDHWDLLADDLLIATDAAPERPVGMLLNIAPGVQRDVDLRSFVAESLPNPRRPRSELGYLKPLMRRSFLDRARVRYDESLRLGEDYALYAQALLRGARLVLVPACGYVAVKRMDSLSHAHGVNELAALLAADDKLFAEAKTLGSDAIKVLRIHRRSILHKLSHRQLLDAKRNGDWSGVVRHLFKTPSGAAYIFGQTLRARLAG